MAFGEEAVALFGIVSYTPSITRFEGDDDLLDDVLISEYDIELVTDSVVFCCFVVVTLSTLFEGDEDRLDVFTDELMSDSMPFRLVGVASIGFFEGDVERLDDFMSLV